LLRFEAVMGKIIETDYYLPSSMGKINVFDQIIIEKPEIYENF